MKTSTEILVQQFKVISKAIVIILVLMTRSRLEFEFGFVPPYFAFLINP